MKTRLLAATILAVMAMALFACEGGGGGGGSSEPPPNNWDSMVWDQGNWS